MYIASALLPFAADEIQSKNKDKISDLYLKGSHTVYIRYYYMNDIIYMNDISLQSDIVCRSNEYSRSKSCFYIYSFWFQFLVFNIESAQCGCTTSRKIHRTLDRWA